MISLFRMPTSSSWWGEFLSSTQPEPSRLNQTMLPLSASISLDQEDELDTSIGSEGLRLSRIFEMPRKWTFEMPKVRRWVEERLEGRTLNLFGGATRLTGLEVTNEELGLSDEDVLGASNQSLSILHNDVNPDLNPDTCIDAYDAGALLHEFGDGAFDTIVMDPPFSAYQAIHTYGNERIQDITAARRGVERILSPTGRVISLGFNSTGMGKVRGFVKEDLLLVNMGGSHNDMIILSERRVR